MKIYNDLEVVTQAGSWHLLFEGGWFGTDDPALLNLRLLERNHDHAIVLLGIKIAKLSIEFSLERRKK